MQMNYNIIYVLSHRFVKKWKKPRKTEKIKTNIKWHHFGFSKKFFCSFSCIRQQKCLSCLENANNRINFELWMCVKCVSSWNEKWMHPRRTLTAKHQKISCDSNRCDLYCKYITWIDFGTFTELGILFSRTQCTAQCNGQKCCVHKALHSLVFRTGHTIHLVLTNPTKNPLDAKWIYWFSKWCAKNEKKQIISKPFSNRPLLALTIDSSFRYAYIKSIIVYMCLCFFSFQFSFTLSLCVHSRVLLFILVVAYLIWLQSNCVYYWWEREWESQRD